MAEFLKAALTARKAKSGAVPSFSELDPAALIKMPLVLTVVPKSSNQIYRDIAAGKFPKALKLSSQSVAWRVSDIREYLSDPQGWADRNAVAVKQAV
jgi:prophage regulatory protein